MVIFGKDIIRPIHGICSGMLSPPPALAELASRSLESGGHAGADAGLAPHSDDGSESAERVGLLRVRYFFFVKIPI